MFKYKQKIFIIFILCIILSSLSLTACSKEPKPHIYIALGDSVPSGYGLASPEESYPAIFYELLKTEDFVDEYKNMAVSGYTTTMLLELLSNMDDENLSIIRNARIITLNIGGNNILIPFLEYLADLKVKTGADNIKTGTGELLSGTEELIYGIIAEVQSRTSESDENESGFNGIISGLKGMAKGLFNTLSGAWNILLGSPEAVSTFSGSFSADLKKELDNDVQTFSDEFIKIITWIETHAPKATIIVNTVYNPFPHEVLNMSLEFFNAANVYIESMNNIIIEESKTRGYLLIDTYTHLTNQLNMMNLNLDPSAGEISFDIHPNSEGHNLIAQLNYNSFKEYMLEKK